MLLRDGYICHYCFVKLYPGTASVDHILSLKNGGLWTKENLTASCVTCNRKKASALYSVFVNQLKEAA